MSCTPGSRRAGPLGKRKCRSAIIGQAKAYEIDRDPQIDAYCHRLLAPMVTDEPHEVVWQEMRTQLSGGKGTDVLAPFYLLHQYGCVQGQLNGKPAKGRITSVAHCDRTQNKFPARQDRRETCCNERPIL